MISAVHEAVIKPVSEGIGGMIAGGLRPIIYGADGKGGIAGAFKGIFGGGKQDPPDGSSDRSADRCRRST